MCSDESALAFNSPGYYKEYRVAADAGLVGKEKRKPGDKRGVGAPVEFQAASYRPIYREAEEAYDVGAKEKRDALEPTAFGGSAYRAIYRESEVEGLAAKEKRTGWTLDPNVIGADDE